MPVSGRHQHRVCLCQRQSAPAHRQQQPQYAARQHPTLCKVETEASVLGLPPLIYPLLARLQPIKLPLQLSRSLTSGQVTSACQGTGSRRNLAPLTMCVPAHAACIFPALLCASLAPNPCLLCTTCLFACCALLIHICSYCSFLSLAVHLSLTDHMPGL